MYSKETGNQAKHTHAHTPKYVGISDASKCKDTNIEMEIWNELYPPKINEGKL